MSFANEVKEEILSHEYTKEQFILFMHGIYVSGISTTSTEGSCATIELRSSSPPLMRKIIKFFKNEYNSKTNLSIRQNLIKKTKVFIVKIYNVGKFLQDSMSTNFDIENTSDVKRWFERSDLIRAYFCGLFLGCGSVNSPSTSNYHLELKYNKREIAERDILIINTFGFGFKIYSRSTNRIIIYIKKSLLVSDFLKFLDVSNSVLRFEQVRIQRDFKNSQNRIINIETSNQLKVLITSKKQIDDIVFLVNNNLFSSLPKNTQILLYERLKNDSATYDELKEILNKKGIKISKPTIGVIFGKIKKIVELEKNNGI
ncbi:DNA-binding protein WhiA [Spiroplasma endosymbiont of Aspidapion aeneum]|uniref:DNA-binding protein WhiA n=1 Tax=Spiroplasma endosymbiont of Aspidapion aeneum TaxID=3066276 RepID=UPI00313C53E4